MRWFRSVVCFIDMSPLIFSHSFTCSSAGMFFIQCKEMEQVSPLLTGDMLSSMLIFSINIVWAANFIYLLDIEILNL